MNCAPELIEAYVDEELDAAQRSSIEAHLAACAECSGTIARLRQQKAEISAFAPYYAAPADLRNSIHRALLDESRPRMRQWPWRELAIAASVLLVVSVSWNVIELRRARTGTSLSDTIIADHIRSLLGTHLLDVPSSDQHTVKPWFAGKLDFSPEVKNLDAEGFPLVGGRVDYLDGRRVAALVYQRRQHIINLFTWPTPQTISETQTTRNGYNVLHWTDRSMTYWAVSDVSPAELDRFKELYTGRLP